MSNVTICTPSGDFHGYLEILDDGYERVTFIKYMDTGAKVPADICICAAHNASECVCGAWDRDEQ